MTEYELPGIFCVQCGYRIDTDDRYWACPRSGDLPQGVAPAMCGALPSWFQSTPLGDRWIAV
jgi:hypothetical protein